MVARKGGDNDDSKNNVEEILTTQGKLWQHSSLTVPELEYDEVSDQQCHLAAERRCVCGR